MSSVIEKGSCETHRVKPVRRVVHVAGHTIYISKTGDRFHSGGEIIRRDRRSDP
jgi:hypothetical protein